MRLLLCLFLGAATLCSAQTNPPGVTGPMMFTLPGSPVTNGLVYVNAIVSATNTVAGTTSETFYGSTYTIPANSLQAGDVIKIELMGNYSTTGLSGPTLRHRVYLGSALLIDTGNAATQTGVSGGGWTGEGSLVFQVVGAGGSVDAQAYMELQTGAAAGQNLNAPGLSPIPVNTAVDQPIRVSAQWSAANTGNSITLRQLKVYKYRAQ